MANFDHIRSGENSRHTTTVIHIEGLADMRPALVCRPASEANPPYFNALLKRQRRGRARLGARVDVATIRKLRDDDRYLLAAYCVQDWDPDTVRDVNGEAVPFSIEACHDLFRALPDELFDDFRNEVADSSTFEILDDPEDIDTLRGNSPGG